MGIQQRNYRVYQKERKKLRRTARAEKADYESAFSQTVSDACKICRQKHRRCAERILQKQRTAAVPFGVLVLYGNAAGTLSVYDSCPLYLYLHRR